MSDTDRTPWDSTEHEEILVGMLIAVPEFRGHVHDLQASHLFDARTQAALVGVRALDAPRIDNLAAWLDKNGPDPPPGFDGWVLALSRWQDRAPASEVALAGEKAAIVRAYGERVARSILVDAAARSSNGELPSEAIETIEKRIREYRGDKDRGGLLADFLSASRTHAELMADTRTAPPSILGDGLLRPRTFAMMFSPPGCAKSWAALVLVVMAALGRDWYGMKTRAVRTGYISLELEIWDLKVRLRRIAAAYEIDHDQLADRLHYIAPPDFDHRIDILTPEGREAIKAWIKAHRIELVVLDTLTRAHTADELDLRDVSAAVEEIARECNCAVLLIHHTRKPAQTGGRKRSTGIAEARGDSRIQGDARLMIGVERIEDRLRLTVGKSNLGSAPPPVWLEQNADGVPMECEPPTKPTEQAAERRATMLDAIEKAGEQGATQADLMELLDVSDATVRKYARDFEAKGAIEITGKAQRTRYKVPKDPRGSG